MTSDDPKEAAKDIAAGARKSADEAKGDVRDAVSSAGDRAGHIGDKIAGAAADASDQLQTGTSRLADSVPQAGDAFEAGRRVYDQGARRVARQVERQPIEALLLAGAIGYLVGWAANRS